MSATVTNNCTISTAALTFAPYDPVIANASSDLDGTGRVTRRLHQGRDARTSALAAAAARLAAPAGCRTARASTILPYELFQDSGRSVSWANSGSGILTTIAATSKAARDFTVYGRIAGNQDVPAGAYADTRRRDRQFLDARVPKRPITWLND